MNTLTLHFPESKYQRLKPLAESQGISRDCLFDELTTSILAEFEARAQFEARALRGQNQAERGLALLKKANKQK